MFHKRGNKFIALILAAVMLLSGCAGKTGEGKQPDDLIVREKEPESSPVSAEGSWQGEGGCYRLTDPELREELSNAYVLGEDIYAEYRNWTMISENRGTFTMDIRREDEEFYHTSNLIHACAVGAAGIWVLEDVADYPAESDAKYHLIQIAGDNGILHDVDITQHFGDSYPMTMKIDKEEQIFIMLSDSIIVFGQDSSYICRIDLETYPGGLVLGGDGEVYVLSDDKSAALSLDTQAKTAVLAAEYSGYSICNGGDGYLFTLVNDDGLYGVSERGGAAEPIAIWAECGISLNNLSNVQFMTEGRFLLRDWSGIYILKPIDPSEFKDKKVLTMATVSSRSSLESIAAEFNLWSEDYMVKVVCYNQENKQSSAGRMESISEAITRLNMDIISGNVPDLFEFTFLPEAYYADKGLIADLYEFVDKDQDISREDFILLNKLENEGKLYYAANRFVVESAVGLWSRFGDCHGWTLDKYLEIQSQYSGELMYNVTREGFLRTLTNRYAATAVDWEAGTCDFENKEFIKILESVSAIRENPEPEDNADINYTPAGQRMREGTLIASYLYIDSVSALASMEKEAGEKLSLIGLPTVDGSGGTALGPQGMAGICTGGDQEGAWEFIKYMLTKGAVGYSNYGISSNKALLEARIADALTPLKATGEPLMKASDVDRLYELLEHSVYYGTASEDVVNIVLEEASAFLAGAKSAEDTAHIIQSRVGILAAE